MLAFSTTVSGLPPRLPPPFGHLHPDRSLPQALYTSHSLRSYKPETFETLAHQQTVDKLVRYFGYPEVREGEGRPLGGGSGVGRGTIWCAAVCFCF